MYSIRLKIENGILRIEHVGGHVPEGSFQITGEDSGGVYGGGDITRVEVEQRDPMGRFVNRAEHAHSRRDVSVPYVQTYHSPTLPGRSRSISDFRGEPHYGERYYGQPDDLPESVVRGHPGTTPTAGPIAHGIETDDRYTREHLRHASPGSPADPYAGAFRGILPRTGPDQFDWSSIPGPGGGTVGEHPEAAASPGTPSVQDYGEAARTGRSPIDIMRERIGDDAVPTDGDFERASLEATGGQPDMNDVDEGLPVPMPQVGPGLSPQTEEVMDEPPRATGSDGTPPSGPDEG